MMESFLQKYLSIQSLILIKLKKDNVEQLSSSKERHSGINHSSNGHSGNVSGDEHQNSQASKLKLQSIMVNSLVLV